MRYHALKEDWISCVENMADQVMEPMQWISMQLYLSSEFLLVKPRQSKSERKVGLHNLFHLHALKKTQ